MTTRYSSLLAGLVLLSTACTASSGSGAGAEDAGADLCPSPTLDGGVLPDGGASAGSDGGAGAPLPEGVVCDPRTGLFWQAQASPEAKVQGQANSLCADLTLGDIDGWRLPDITELRSLVDGCAVTALGGQCKVDAPDCLLAVTCFDTTCIGCGAGEGPGRAGCYFDLDGKLGGPCGPYWSSSMQDGFGSAAFYILDFSDGKINVVSDAQGAYVRCVYAREGLPDIHRHAQP